MAQRGLGIRNVFYLSTDKGISGSLFRLYVKVCYLQKRYYQLQLIIATDCGKHSSHKNCEQEEGICPKCETYIKCVDARMGCFSEMFEGRLI